MKITQEPKFQPITMVIETKLEAETIWKAIELLNDQAQMAPAERGLLNRLSDWFGNQAQL